MLLAAGRLEAQKGFATLIDAFAALRRYRWARLMILGDGSQRAELEQRSRAFGIEEDVAWVGWVDNPYADMSRARVFVLSSDYSFAMVATDPDTLRP